MNVLSRKEITLSASVSCCDLYNLSSQIPQLKKAGVSLLHFDVVDGKFNDCMILGTPTLAAIRPHTDLPIEVHLGVCEPEKFINQFAEAGADYIAVHYETLHNPDLVLSQIRQAGAEPLLALRAETEVDAGLIRLLPEVDWIIKLTVDPGYAGQSFKPETLNQIKKLRATISSFGLKTGIEADGNINCKTIPLVVEAGADMLTGGSSGLFVENEIVEAAAEKMLLTAWHSLKL